MTTTKSRRSKVVKCSKCNWSTTAADKFDAERQIKEHREHAHSDR